MKTQLEKAAYKRFPEKQQLSMLKQQLHSGGNSFPDKIALPFQNGVQFVEIKNVIYCESDNNYTRFIMMDGRQHTVAKTRGDIQEVLEERNFLRVHRQFLVNLDQIKKYVRCEGNYLVLSNDKNIQVARNQKDKLVHRFGWR